MAIPTTPLDVTRNVMFFESATQGVLPTDPVMKNAGLQATIKKSSKKSISKIDIIGSPDPYSFMQMGNSATFDLTYKMLDTVLPRYGTELEGGTGTIEKAINFVLSRKINGTEMFRIFQDCITDSISIKYGEFYEVTQTFYCSVVSAYMTLAAFKTALGISGTPQYAPALTGNPWSNLNSTPGTPITINGTNTYNLEGLTVNYNRNVIVQRPMSNINPIYLRAGHRNITGTLEVDLDNTTLDSIYEAFTNSTIVYRVFTGSPNVDHTLNGVR